MHRRQACSTAAKPLGQLCTDGTTLCGGNLWCVPIPEWDRQAKRTMIKALGHTRMICTLYSGRYSKYRVHYSGPQFLETFGPLCHQRQPCACVRLGAACVCLAFDGYMQ